MEVRDILMADCRRMIDGRAFGNDQTHPAFRAAAVICRHLRARYALRRMHPGHRCHHHTVTEGQASVFKRFKQCSSIHNSLASISYDDYLLDDYFK